MPVCSQVPDVAIPSGDVASLFFGLAQGQLDHCVDEEPPMLIDGVTGEQLRFSALRRMAESVAHALAAAGFSFAGPSRVAAVLSPPDIRLCPIHYGVLLAGGTYTVVDPDMGAAAVAERLQEVDASVVFVAPELLPRLGTSSLRTILIRGNKTPHQPSIDALEHRPWTLSPGPASDTLAGRVALIVYSSGTTGRPKGIQLTHGNVIAMHALLGGDYFRKMTLQRASRPRLLSCLPLHHIYGHCLLCYQPLFAGGCCVQLPQFDTAQYLGTIEQYGITGLGATPAILHTLLHTTEKRGPGRVVLREDPAQEFDISSVRSMSCGGARTPPHWLQQYTDYFDQALILVGYGQTETMSILAGGAWKRPAPGATGVLYPNCSAKVIDETGEETDGFGELCVTGPNVMKGYVGGRPVPWTADGFLRTGDCACIDQDSNVFLKGRMADIIYMAQGPLYSVDLEDELASHPGVRDMAVVGRGPPGAARPIAYVVLQEPGTGQLEAIKTWLAEQTGIVLEFRKVVAIPKSPAGKILHGQLPA